MNKDEKNRAIAEWLEPMPSDVGHRRMAVLSPGGAWINSFDAGWVPQDFFTSEEASALVLDKIRSLKLSCTLTCADELYWGAIVLPDFEGAKQGMDRKTAIAEAALALIEREKSNRAAPPKSPESP